VFKNIKKLIRTTYWTRKDQTKRPDEDNDDENRMEKGVDNEAALFTKTELKSSNSIELTTTTNNKRIETQMELVARPTSYNLTFLINLLLSLACGFEKIDDRNKELNLQAQTRIEKQRKLDSIKSLNQTRLEKWTLNLNLILIIVISCLLFIFFSI